MAYDQDKLNIPKTVKFDTDMEFGWDFDIYKDVNSKVSYLWILICSKYSNYSNQELFSKIKQRLINVLISAGVEEIIFAEEKYHKGYYATAFLNIPGYIDHYTEVSEMLEELLSNDQMLLSYLFNSDSIIGTGNDNDDREVEINENAKWIFRKGN
jgi:hypothetical protein